VENDGFRVKLRKIDDYAKKGFSFKKSIILDELETSVNFVRSAKIGI